MKDLLEIIKEYLKRIFAEKQAEVLASVTYPEKNICEIDIKIKRLKDNWAVGNASFLINHDRINLANPELIYSNPKYSSGEYEPLQVIPLLQNRILAIQLRCNLLGSIPELLKYETICTIRMDVIATPLNLKWRSQDTALVTPGFITINTNYIITDYGPY